MHMYIESKRIELGMDFPQKLMVTKYKSFLREHDSEAVFLMPYCPLRHCSVLFPEPAPAELSKWTDCDTEIKMFVSQ